MRARAICDPNPIECGRDVHVCRYLRRFFVRSRTRGGPRARVARDALGDAEWRSAGARSRAIRRIMQKLVDCLMSDVTRELASDSSRSGRSTWWPGRARGCSPTKMPAGASAGILRHGARRIGVGREPREGDASVTDVARRRRGRARFGVERGGDDGGAGRALAGRCFRGGRRYDGAVLSIPKRWHGKARRRRSTSFAKRFRTRTSRCSSDFARDALSSGGLGFARTNASAETNGTTMSP